MLSVALCTFNGALFIEEQLLSILNQRLPVDEIVIRDDGSSDETLPLVLSIAKAHPEIIWDIKQNPERVGVTKNFEKALTACHGDIIFLSDQDDIWLPEKTERMVDYLHFHPEINLLFTNATIIDDKGQRFSEWTLFDQCGLADVLDAWDAGLQFEIENVAQRLYGATFAIRKSFLCKCTPFNLEIQTYHDGHLAMQSVVDQCNGRIDECLIRYRIHTKNVVGLGGNAEGRLTKKVVLFDWNALLEPWDVKPFFLLPRADPIRYRVRFYIKRRQYYSSCYGKIILAVSLFDYIKYYRRFWIRFYLGDLIYGVSDTLRHKWVLS